MKDGTKVLGVIGGMGPLASQLFYKMVIEKTDAQRDQDHINMIILSHATMPDRTEAIKEGRLEELLLRFSQDLQLLQESGADYAAIPCNTSHVLIDRLQEEHSLPVLNMIQITAQNIGKRLEKGAKVGIMATDGTIKQNLYQKECKKLGLTPVVPSSESQKRVMKIIYEGVKKGEPVDYNDFEAVERELRGKGCCCVIMACTELSCFKEQQGLSDFFVDAMEELAEESILLCGKKLRRNDK
ncbi:MAG: amino acid racemase [Firmicutes bacterium]|nr:amino acid racemase [Bacillota bacterium]